MAKKVNNRAHKRALKNAKRQNNKNILEKQIKKEKKELTESFAYQWELFSNDIQTKIRDIKKDINVSLAKVKFNFNSLFKNKKQQEDSLKEFAEHLNLKRQLCLMLSYLLSFNCGATLIESLSYDESKPNVRAVLEEAQDSLQDSPKGNIEDYIVLSSHQEIVRKEPAKTQIIEEVEPQLLTDEEKKSLVLMMYDITEDQLKYIVAKVLLEAGEYYDGLQEPGSINRYDECKNVISTGFNRITSPAWISLVNKRMGEGTGTNLYYQFKCPAQFTVSEYTTNYLASTDLTVYSGYKAVIEMLLLGEPSHNMCRFVSPRIKYKYEQYGCVPLSENGNYYFYEINDSDRIDLGSILPNYNRYVGLTTQEEVMDANNEKIKMLTFEHRHQIM